MEKFISEREFSKIAAQKRRDKCAAIVDRWYRSQDRWSLEALADKFGYNSGLLRRKMQHGESVAFNANDFVVLFECGCTELLEFIVHECGSVSIPIPDPSHTYSNPTTAAFMVNKRSGDLAAEMAAATSEDSEAGKDFSLREAERICKTNRELQQDAAALDLVMKGLEGKP